LSSILSILWLICTLLIWGLFLTNVKEDIKFDFSIKWKEKNSFTRYIISIIYWSFDELLNAIFVFGLDLMQIFIYLQTYYIFYCMKRTHYKKLSEKNSENCLKKLQYFGKREIEIQLIEHKLNELIGFVPIVWLTEMFIRSCINITQVSQNWENFLKSSIYSIDFIIFYLIVITVVIIVGRLNSEYDINAITAIVHKSFSFKYPNDQNLNLEIIQFLQLVTNGCNNKPKSLGLFEINSNLILTFVNTVITFSVMCIQLKPNY
jgi:hypothetical protein